MNLDHLHLLACPVCLGALSARGEPAANGRLLEGALRCAGCDKDFPVTGGIPRFVPRENYASGFGLEWNKHARTQYDSHSGLPLSRERFFSQTHWPQDLRGELILEVGSGSGRFTEQAANTGATVVSFDYSDAVEANFASNGARDNTLIVQADIYAVPCRPHLFDRLFCFGMLQHTPDPQRSFRVLPDALKPGGALCADIYKATLLRTLFQTKYYVRPLTRRMEPQRLYRLTCGWVDLMWPLASLIRRLPGGSGINWRLLVADYSGLGLKGDILKEWAYLDTFDMLAPRYDRPISLETFRQWAAAAQLQSVETEYTGHGVVLRARTAAGEPHN